MLEQHPCKWPTSSALGWQNFLTSKKICIFFLSKLMIQVQDEQLDMVGHSVGVLKTMGKKIGDEIEEQNL